MLNFSCPPHAFGEGIFVPISLRKIFTFAPARHHLHTTPAPSSFSLPSPSAPLAYFPTCLYLCPELQSNYP